MAENADKARTLKLPLALRSILILPIFITIIIAMVVDCCFLAFCTSLYLPGPRTFTSLQIYIDFKVYLFNFLICSVCSRHMNANPFKKTGNNSEMKRHLGLPLACVKRTFECTRTL